MTSYDSKSKAHNLQIYIRQPFYCPEHQENWSTQVELPIENTDFKRTVKELLERQLYANSAIFNGSVTPEDFQVPDELPENILTTRIRDIPSKINLILLNKASDNKVCTDCYEKFIASKQEQHEGAGSSPTYSDPRVPLSFDTMSLESTLRKFSLKSQQRRSSSSSRSDTLRSDGSSKGAQRRPDPSPRCDVKRLTHNPPSYEAPPPPQSAPQPSTHQPTPPPTPPRPSSLTLARPLDFNRYKFEMIKRVLQTKDVNDDYFALVKSPDDMAQTIPFIIVSLKLHNEQMEHAKKVIRSSNGELIFHRDGPRFRSIVNLLQHYKEHKTNYGFYLARQLTEDEIIEYYNCRRSRGSSQSSQSFATRSR